MKIVERRHRAKACVARRRRNTFFLGQFRSGHASGRWYDNYSIDYTVAGPNLGPEMTNRRHLILALQILVKPALRGPPYFFIVETLKVAENARGLPPSLTPGSQVDRATR